MLHSFSFSYLFPLPVSFAHLEFLSFLYWLNFLKVFSNLLTCLQVLFYVQKLICRPNGGLRKLRLYLSRMRYTHRPGHHFVIFLL